MLIAAIAALTFIFWPKTDALTRWYDQAESLIEKEVHDEARRKEALEIVAQAETATKKDIEAEKKAIDSLAKVLQNRESTADEIQAALQPLSAADAANAQEQLGWRLQLRTVLTASEWAEVFPAPGLEKKGKEAK